MCTHEKINSFKLYLVSSAEKYDGMWQLSKLVYKMDMMLHINIIMNLLCITQHTQDLIY
jgi:hypothetical protein